MNHDRDDAPAAALTPREEEIVRLARLGYTNNEIAERLGITRNAVRFHLKEIHSKLGTGGERSHLAGGWTRVRGLLAFPAAKFGLPATVAAFTGGIALVAAAAYQAMPAKGRPSPHRRRSKAPSSSMAATRMAARRSSMPAR